MNIEHVGRPWMVALEKRLDAIKALEQVLAAAAAQPFEVSGQLVNMWRSDLKWLKRAETFDWSPTAIKACQAAAATIPCELTKLKFELTPPSSSGWWWFQEPIDGAATTTHKKISAITYRWGYELDEERVGKAGLIMTVYVMANDLGQMLPVPTTVWAWYESETLHEMLARISREHDDRYGPGGVYEHAPRVGKEGTLKLVANLSSFFIAACAWMEQKILVETSGHVERHARKRAERDHKVSVDKVRVVQLRRAEHRQRDEPAEGTAEHVEWTCRWVVSGHWRHQPHGPAKKERKLIYISPFVKGPDDKPLREHEVKKVYEVNR